MNLLSVNFHYFGETKFDFGIYPVNSTQLKNQLCELAKGYDFISQDDLADCFVKQQFPEGNFCLITFDDGLRQQMDASELLQSLSIPAVFYIPVQPLVEHSVLDVHKLQLIRTQLKDTELLQSLRVLPAYAYTVDDAQKAATQYKYDDETARELKFQLNFKLSSTQKQHFLSQTFTYVFGNEQDFARKFYMHTNDLKQLASFNQLGAHGYAHVPLARSSDALADMKKSKDYLHATTGQAIRSISYPYGSTEAVNDTVALHAQSLGFDFGLTMWRGLNTLNASTNPFLLQRVDTNDAPGGKLQSTDYIQQREDSNSRN